MANLTEEQIQKLIQDVQSAEQAVQEAKQTIQNAGVLSKDIAGGKENLGFEDVTHDIDTVEAHKASVLSQTRLWNYNDKALAELELAKKQHDFSVQQNRDAVAQRAAEHAELIKHLANAQALKFGTASDEPYSPNTDE